MDHDEEGGAAAAPGPDKEMAEEMREVQQRLAQLHDGGDGDGGDGDGGAPAAPAVPDMLEKVAHVCSVTGAEQDLAELWVRRTKGDVNQAIAQVYAHHNRVAKGWIKPDAASRAASDAHGKTVLWIDLVGGEGIRYALDARERCNPLNHYFQVVIDGPYGQRWTSSAVRRALSPMWKEQVPFVLPTSSVVYLRVTIVSLHGDAIATGEAKLPVRRSGTIACSCSLVAARPGARESGCGNLLVTASQTRLGPTSIVAFAGARRLPRDDVEFDAEMIFADEPIAEAVPTSARLPRAPMRTISEPARVAEQVENPLLGPDLDAIQDDFDVQRTKTSDRVRMSAARYTLADDSHGSEDLLLRLLRRRLATKEVKFADNRVDTKSQVAPPSVCDVCKKAPSFVGRGEAPELLRSCGHAVCADCLAKHVITHVNEGKASSIGCPARHCKLALTPTELQRMLCARDFELYENACLSEYLNKSTVGRCPKCQATFVVEKNPKPTDPVATEGVDTTKRNKDGKPVMSRSALKHYNQNRFRCAECSASFCTLCQATPFHAGYDNCDAYALAVSGRQCRWCETVLTDENIWKNYQCKGSLKNTCRESDCTKRALAACRTTHKCGHECGGVKEENEHLPCLQCKEVPDVNHDDFCPICWTEGISLAPALKLACGHIVHEHCVKKQLEDRWGDKPRIQFGFMSCSACRQDVFHPMLERVFIKPLLDLRKRVREMADEQMKIEYPMMEAEEQAKADEMGHAEYAEGHLSFELCHRCQLPYFAGRVDCAAGVDEAGPEALARAEDGVCASCRDLTGLMGKPCPKHGKEALVWKCRYGCHLATYECFQYAHFCTPCHGNEILSKYMDFNTRVGEGHPRRGGVPGKDKVYANKLDVWEYPQCPGPDKCPLGNGTVHPPTGIEYCFGCSLCKDELAIKTQQLEPLRAVFLKIAVQHAGHLDGFDEDNLEELGVRLLHAFSFVGHGAVTASHLSKREAIRALQFAMQKAGIPLDKYEVKLSGSEDSLRKSRSLTDIASVVTLWRAEPAVLEHVERSSCLVVSVTRKATDPTRPIITVSARYVQEGAAKPEDAIAGSSTVQDVVDRLVATSGITAAEASKITLHGAGGAALAPGDKLLPLFAGPELELTTRLSVGAAAKAFSECVVS